MLLGASRPPGEYRLTDREKQVLDLMVDGLTRKDFADKLDVLSDTIFSKKDKAGTPEKHENPENPAKKEKPEKKGR